MNFMTIGEYLKNPYGKGSAFSSSSKQKDDLDAQFKEIADKIISKIYRYRDFVIYHVVVPSTKKESNSYDVVVEVETKKLHDGAATLEDIPFRIFSNCPSFIFTYANVFRSNGMLCEWLLPKYNPEVRTKSPNVRNQYGIIGLERSMYLALKHLHTTGKTKNSTYLSTGKKISGRTEIINAVRTQQQIMEKAREKIPDEKSKTIVGKDDLPFGTKSISTNRHSSTEKHTKKIELTRSVKTMKEVSKTKTSKSTKKI